MEPASQIISCQIDPAPVSALELEAEALLSNISTNIDQRSTKIAACFIFFKAFCDWLLCLSFCISQSVPSLSLQEHGSEHSLSVERYERAREARRTASLFAAAVCKQSGSLYINR